MEQEKQPAFYAYLSRMKYINRWGLMRNTDTENIQEHSLETALLAHALTLIHNRLRSGALTPDAEDVEADGSTPEALAAMPELNPERACVYAMFHDANEILTGDMPTPVKYYNPRIREHYGQIESVAREKLLGMLPAWLAETYRGILFYEEMDAAYYPLVKAADRLSAYIKCEAECKAGNLEFSKARESVMRSMRAMHVPALSYFIRRFLPAYSLTLDELD